jgi:hypothetical protein
MNKHKLGDSIWVPRTGLRQTLVLCPICYGKLAVTVILGNNDTVTTPCDYCGNGFEGPRGVVPEYSEDPSCELLTITGIEAITTVCGETVEYHCGSSVVKEDMAFTDRESAMVKARELTAELLRDERTRAECIKKNKLQSYSWNAGYHLREAKDAEKRAAYHREKAALCKARSKAEPMKDLRDMNRHYCAKCKRLTEHICACRECGATIGTPPKRDAGGSGAVTNPAKALDNTTGRAQE